MDIIIWGIIGFIVLVGLWGMRIVRPVEEMLVETLGKYSRTAKQGFSWVIPLIQTSRKINITEKMVDVAEQIIQTKDKLNTKVDAVVYYQVLNVRSAEYNIDNYKKQLPVIARNTLRAVMGKMTLTECIQERNTITKKVEEVMGEETKNYGVAVLRVEIQRIEPPRDVQEAMNEVVKAEQQKIAAKDTATALETEADGEKRAAIKVAEGNRQSAILNAEGNKQAAILEAEGKAKAFELVRKEFKDEAQVLKRLEVTQASLENNAKIILTKEGINPTLLIGELPLSN